MRKILVALGLCMSLSAYAGETYVGANFDMIDIDVDGTSFDTGGIRGTYGKYLDNTAGITFPIAVEGRFGFGLLDDDAGGVTVSTDTYWGLYAKAELTNLGAITPYGILGYSSISATAKGFGEEISDDDSGFSFGVGARYHYSNLFTLNFEFMNLVDDVSALSFGVQMRL